MENASYNLGMRVPRTTAKVAAAKAATGNSSGIGFAVRTNKGRKGVRFLKSLVPPGNMKRPKGQAAREFFERVRKDHPDWKLTNKCQASFVMLKFVDGKVADARYVECKARRSRRLKKEVKILFDFLTAHGIRCYEWTIEEGFEEYQTTARASSYAPLT